MSSAQNTGRLFCRSGKAVGAPTHHQQWRGPQSKAKGTQLLQGRVSWHSSFRRWWHRAHRWGTLSPSKSSPEYPCFMKAGCWSPRSLSSFTSTLIAARVHQKALSPQLLHHSWEQSAICCLDKPALLPAHLNWQKACSEWHLAHLDTHQSGGKLALDVKGQFCLFVNHFFLAAVRREWRGRLESKERIFLPQKTKCH